VEDRYNRKVTQTVNTGKGDTLMTTTHGEKDIERFDHWSNTYEDSWMQHALFDQAHRATLALATGLVHQPVSVLDVGCGTGKLLRRARISWPQAQLIGVDPANGMIEKAKRLTPDATFFTSMAEVLPLQDASVDLALSTISFHHWQDQVAGIREIARVLRPGGYFLLVDMSFPHWLVRGFRLKRVHSRTRLQALFTQAGLQVQAQQRVAWRGWLATVGKK
jgi:ubiquinone/menaquinone biosynthesis C-methylase UbiE